MAAPKVAVVGAGVIGLSTALCIAETCPSCSVTVLSDQFSPNTTSDVAAGMLIPHTYPGTPIHVQKQWFKETFTYLFAISNSAEASEAGIHLVSGWQVFKTTPKEELPFWSDVVLGFRPMSEAELQKFPQHRFGQAFTTLKCDCPPYLLWLEKSSPASGISLCNISSATAEFLLLTQEPLPEAEAKTWPVLTGELKPSWQLRNLQNSILILNLTVLLHQLHSLHLEVQLKKSKVMYFGEGGADVSQKPAL